MNIRQRKRMAGDEPAIDQGITNGWHITRNPDDDRYYVHHPVHGRTGIAVKTFNALRNARQWARNHNVD